MAELRDYLPSDFEKLWVLDQRCFSQAIAYSREELSYYLKQRNAICIVAAENERISGFILGHSDPRGFGHVVTLDVESESRRSGLGSTLMQSLEERFRANGCKSVLLEVAVDNHTALTFYKKHGYSAIKTLRRYYPGDLDGLLMGKRL